MVRLHKAVIASTAIVCASVAAASAHAADYDAFAQYNTTDGSNIASALWQYRAAKNNSTAPSSSVLIPNFSHSSNSTAELQNANNNWGLTVPDTEKFVWKSLYSYMGSITYDTAFEEPDADHDGRELVTYLSFSTGPTLSGIPAGSIYHNTLLAFAPTLTEPTLMQFNFAISSNYQVNGGQDENASTPGAGERLGLFLNDTQLPASTFWAEDNNSANGEKISNSEWVYLPPFFARFDNPAPINFAITMNPGDVFYLNINDNGNYLFDGVLLTQATANAIPEPASIALFSLAGFAMLRRRRRADIDA